jgi:hypothetical protein
MLSDCRLLLLLLLCLHRTGLAGILYMLLHCMPLVQELDREDRRAVQPTVGSAGSSGGVYCAAVRGAVDALAEAAFTSGNLPTKLGDREDV